MQAVGGGFHHDAAGLVGNQPMQLGQGQLVTEWNIDDVCLFQQRAGLGQGGAAAQQPGDQFKLCDVVFTLSRRMVDRVTHKVQPRNTEALLIDSVVIQRVLPAT